jgi:hypothetical protein
VQARLWLAANEDLELVAPGEILESKVSAGTTAITENTKQHHQDVEHRRGRISVQRTPPFARP